MTDQTPSTPAPRPDDTPAADAAPVERLPATVPQQSLTADRFSATPSVKATAGLTPQRSAGIVRQSAAARWVGFLTVIFVSLFVVGYWFYELGAPAGISTARLQTEIERQQVVDVQRGYNLYEANCARCHGPNGLGPNEPDVATAGYIGPQLNDQVKLFAHLSEAYLENVLTVGGRYVCGNPKSAMPAWADTGNPPGPMNYRQIEELIAFLRAPNNKEYEVRDHETNEPIIDPATGQKKMFKGWRDPNYKPDPGATPFPACWTDALKGGGAGGSGAPTASIDPSAPTVTVAAKDGAASAGFEPTTLEAKADTAFTLIFDNQDATTGPHNVVISDSGKTPVSMGDTAFFTGPEKRSYAVPALAAGTYTFVCTVHPAMTGTLEVK